MNSRSRGTDYFIEKALRKLVQVVKEKYPGCEPIVRQSFLVVREGGLYAFLHASYHKALSKHTKEFITKHLRNSDREYCFNEPMLVSVSIEAFVDRNLNVHLREIGRVYLLGLRRTHDGSTTAFKWITTPGVKLKFTYKPLVERLEELRGSKPVHSYHENKSSYRSIPSLDRLRT